MAAKKILMLVGDFTEEYEIFVFQQGMEAVGHTVHVVCPDKKASDILRTSLHDFEGDQTYTEKLGHNFVINKSFGKVDPADYDAVYCAGGRGPEYIRTDKRVQALVRHFHEARKPIFTICHGVQILIAVDGVVRGKKVAALGACEPEVTLAGGTYIDLSPTEAYVDGTMVSAKGWTALAAFMRECLKVLGTRIVHEDVAVAAAPAARKRSAKAAEPEPAKAAKPAKASKKAAAAPKPSAPARRSRKGEAVATP